MAHRNRWYISTKNSDFPQKPLKLPEDIYRPDVFNHRSTHISSINIHKLYQQNPDSFFFPNHFPIIHLSIYIYIYLLVNHPFHPHIFQPLFQLPRHRRQPMMRSWRRRPRSSEICGSAVPRFTISMVESWGKNGSNIIYHRDIWTYMNIYEHIYI